MGDLDAERRVSPSGRTAAQSSDGWEQDLRRVRAAAFEVVMATEQDDAGRWVITYDGEFFISKLADAVGDLSCTGCGSKRGLASLWVDGYRGCCPERRMVAAQSSEVERQSPSEASAGNAELDTLNLKLSHAEARLSEAKKVLRLIVDAHDLSISHWTLHLPTARSFLAQLEGEGE